MPDDTISDHIIRSEDQLRRLIGNAEGLAVRKVLPRLDRHCKAFIARAPFLCIGTTSADGRADVSPRGDLPGFVEVLDDTSLAIPDRPGNKRLDTMTNILANPAVGLIFMIPGFDDTLRINGRGNLVCDPELLARSTVNGRTPKVAIRIDVEEAFLHCAKAFKRSRLWDPDARIDRKELPSLARMILEQTSADGSVEEDVARSADASLEHNYKTDLY